MQILTSPPPDRRLITAAVRSRSQPALWLIRGLGLLLALVALIDLATSDIFGVFGVSLGLLFAVGAPTLLVRRAVDRCWQFHGMPGTFAITDWGVQRSDALTQHGYSWPAVRGIDAAPEQLLFLIGKAGFMPMPTAALQPGEREQILATAAQRGITVRSVRQKHSAR
ncbi:hypothetical protein [Paractinoplanes toevensis]|uniref:hypothetical protein n=1 Tax=Paractinoplanes toevensis TaxID=571911 RepID=UPI001BB31C5E|nr:hypothetical protein [Actinoplanes toevensis]